MLPESTGGERVYLANIVCADSNFNEQCQRSVDKPPIGNPCIVNLGECIQKNDSNLRINRGPPVESQADWLKKSRPNDVLLSKLTSSSLQRSILMYSIATSALLAIFIGLYMWVAGSLSVGFVIFVASMSGVPNLWTFLGSTYPAINCGLLLALSLASVSLLRSRVKRPNIELLTIAGIALATFYLSSGSRFDLYLGSAWLLGISMFSVIVGKHAFHRRNWITAITIQSVCCIFIYLNKIQGGSQSNSLDLFLGRKLLLAEAGEVAANKAKGLIETGSFSQRIWSGITSPIYYFLDWTVPYIQKINLLSLFVTLLLNVCVLLLCFSNYHPRKIELHIKIYQILVAVSIFLLPMAPMTGHLRLRMIAILALPLALNFLTYKEINYSISKYVISFLAGFNFIVMIFNIISHKSLLSALGFPTYLVASAYILGLSMWFLSTIYLLKKNSEFIVA